MRRQCPHAALCCEPEVSASVHGMDPWRASATAWHGTLHGCCASYIMHACLQLHACAWTANSMPGAAATQRCCVLLTWRRRQACAAACGPPRSASCRHVRYISAFRQIPADLAPVLLLCTAQQCWLMCRAALWVPANSAVCCLSSLHYATYATLQPNRFSLRRSTSIPNQLCVDQACHVVMGWPCQMPHARAALLHCRGMTPRG